ncbi:hypothetical protein JTE90_008402 [Oedothorax gibbosus]|uniref:Uncharacterized protein n=1 Tax=Oedothorax gibbosus TaxID=931172 RepID=A0AAV6V5A9_9ARAC|nr:hypothetical protein JTE90_008402 [Oedothorax gibbosus]
MPPHLTEIQDHEFRGSHDNCCVFKPKEARNIHPEVLANTHLRNRYKGVTFARETIFLRGMYGDRRSVHHCIIAVERCRLGRFFQQFPCVNLTNRDDFLLYCATSVSHSCNCESTLF